MSEHESHDAEEQTEPKVDDLEVSDEESEEVKGGGHRGPGGRPEGAEPHL